MKIFRMNYSDFEEMTDRMDKYSCHTVSIGFDDEGVKFKFDNGVWTPGRGEEIK